MTHSYVLHYAPDNASLAVRLALEEIGVPYRTALVDRSRAAQKSAAHLALNPNGLIPVLETPDGPMFETAAILLWLADRHGALAPAPEALGRAPFLKWLFFLSNTLHAELRMMFYAGNYIGADPGHQAALRAGTAQRLQRHLSILDAALAPRPDWAGDAGAAPSLLDCYLAPCLRWMVLYPEGGTGWFTLARYPTLLARLAAFEPRASVSAAIAAEGLGPTPFTAPRRPIPPEGSAL